MQLFVKFALNKSKAEVQMIDNSIKIPIGGWRGLTMREVDHPDVISAMRREWIDLKDTQPLTPESPEKTVIVLSDPTQGRTIDEIKVRPAVAQAVTIAAETTKTEETPAAKVRKASQKALADTNKKE